MSKGKKLLIVGCFVLLVTVWVQPTISQASKIEFSVETVIPANQRDKEVTYFDLLMKPDTEQELVIKAANPTTEDLTVISEVFAATTNSNGVVEYGESNTELDDTAPYNIRDLVKVNEPEMVIKANSTAEIRLLVTMPSIEFPGLLAGGVTISQKEETTDSTKKAQGMTILNKFNYNIAILLRETESAQAPQLALSPIRVEHINGQSALIAPIQNRQSVFVNQLTVKTTLRQAGKKTVLHESKVKQMQLAPNSTLAYPLWLADTSLKAGEYELTMAVTSKDETWSFKEEFAITSAEAKQLKAVRQSALPLHKQPLFILSIITLLGGTLVIGFMIQAKLKEGRQTKKQLSKA